MGCSLKWEVLQVCCIEMQMRSNKLRMKSTHWPLVVYSPILKIHSPLARKTKIFCKAWSYPEKKHSSTCSITTSPTSSRSAFGSTEPGGNVEYLAANNHQWIGSIFSATCKKPCKDSETWQIKITDTYLFKWNGIPSITETRIPSYQQAPWVQREMDREMIRFSWKEGA